MSALDTILATEKTTHDLVQGTTEWLAFRVEHDGASEAAAMLGLSKKVTRTELLQAKHTGLAREFSEFVQTRVLDKGHEVEALARPLVESDIGEDLYPATCSRGRLSASCDGITLDDRIVFEHKQWNEQLAASVRAGVVPEEHMPQCQQILLVTGAEVVRFVVSDGTAERMVWVEVTADHDWWARIASGWEQFHADLATYVPPERTPAVVAQPVQALPAVTVQVTGSIAVVDNFKVFETAMRDFLEHRLIREPKSDQDFADLDVQIKAMKGAEAALEAAEGQMLAQVQSIDEAKKTKDMLHKLVRDNRLMAEKLLTSEKERRKGEIVAGGIAALSKHVLALNERIGKPYMPGIPADFAGAIRGKSSLAKMEDAVHSELTRAKLAANEAADRIDTNLRYLREHAEDHKTLFPDIATIVLKAADDLQALVTSRIATHQAEEQRRAAAAAEKERERIRQEEADKLRREQEAAQRAQAPAPTQPPAPAPIAAPALSSKPAAANSPSVIPITRGSPTLRIGEIANRLGFGVTEAFLRQLGFAPASKQGASCLFHEDQFDLICEALIAHVRTVQAKQHEAVAA